MRIAVVNGSSQVSRAEAQLMIRACAVQMQRHVIPIWGGRNCDIALYSSASRVPRNSCAIIMMDSYDNAEDAEQQFVGYHAEDEAGVRWGRVFVQPILASDGGSVLGRGLSVSVTLSHEVIEAYVDPDLNLWAEGPRKTLWAYEACDPVEESTYAVSVDGRRVGVSNFVYPTWFDLEFARGAKFDHLGETERPFHVASGYANYRYSRGSKVLTRWADGTTVVQRRARRAGKTSKLARTAKRLLG
jgi:hypothetical protein